MDFKGQALSETLYQVILLILALIGFAVGWIQEDFGIVMRIWLGALGFTVLVCVPDWPVFNRNPLNWSTFDLVKSKSTTSKKKQAAKSE